MKVLSFSDFYKQNLPVDFYSGMTYGKSLSLCTDEAFASNDYYLFFRIGLNKSVSYTYMVMYMYVKSEKCPFRIR